MRVLYLSNGGNRTSLNIPIEGWFRYLCPKGLEPVFVSPESGTFHTWARDERIATYQFPLPFPSKRWPVGFLLALWRLRKLIKRHRIQIVHCNSQDIYPVGHFAARLCGLPVVVTVHSNMGRAYCLWAMGGRRQPQRVFFISKSSMECCREAVSGVIPEQNWRLIYNGLDLERYQPDANLRNQFREQYGLDSQLLVGVASAIRTGKQLEHFLQVAAQVPGQHIHFLLAGRSMPGDEAYGQTLIDEARQTLGDRFHFLGWLEDPRGFFNALDLFVNTSKEEAFGISVLQALACGCPVVGYPSSSVQEVVLPGGGEIVEQDNRGKLGECVNRWLSDPNHLASMRNAVRKQAETFDIRPIADQMWNEYQSVLNGGL